MNEPQLAASVQDLYYFVKESRQSTRIAQRRAKDGELWARFDAALFAYQGIIDYMEKLFPWLEK